MLKRTMTINEIHCWSLGHLDTRHDICLLEKGIEVLEKWSPRAAATRKTVESPYVVAVLEDPREVEPSITERVKTRSIRIWKECKTLEEAKQIAKDLLK